jgi:replicative DNA helicase
LKQLQKKENLLIFAVCSLNRAGYGAQIEFESFKESGMIEYTADVVLGLQLQILSNGELPGGNTADKQGERRTALRAAKKENPRKLELVCLKNRFGPTGWSCGFDYFPHFDEFKEDPLYFEH